MLLAIWGCLGMLDSHPHYIPSPLEREICPLCMGHQLK